MTRVFIPNKRHILFCSVVGYIFILVLVLSTSPDDDTDTEISYVLSSLMSFDYWTTA